NGLVPPPRPTADTTHPTRNGPAAYDSRQTTHPAEHRTEARMQLRKAQPGQTRVGFIGTGVMGHSMCRHLITAGYATTVTTRHKTKADALLQAGAAWADTPKAVAEKSDVVLAIVGFPSDVREVL